MLIVLANISQWAHYFSEIFQNSASNSRNCATTSRCVQNSFYDMIKPYAHPLQMEYFLLSMILIAELWPKSQNHSNLTPRHGNENTPLLSSLNHLLPITASMEDSIESRNLRERQPSDRLLNSKTVACIAGVVCRSVLYFRFYYLVRKRAERLARKCDEWNNVNDGNHRCSI
ncbi:unnamed protein product [Mytilus edulis]|uniref:Uncharacterized protein n=1 Tax=Mytilus edulis TaxID=6550 RepID=A0A8S3T8K8_MYTED|nr:unnamed protein product [Mytilus edulis]